MTSVYGGPIPVAESLEAGIAGMRKLIDSCIAAGGESLLMGGIGNKKLFQTYYKAVAECCDYAAENQVESPPVRRRVNRPERITVGVKHAIRPCSIRKMRGKQDGC